MSHDSVLSSSTNAMNHNIELGKMKGETLSLKDRVKNAEDEIAEVTGDKIVWENMQDETQDSIISILSLSMHPNDPPPGFSATMWNSITNEK